MSIETEIWEKVKSYGGLYSRYEVSSEGQIRNSENGHILTPQLHDGYYHVRLTSPFGSRTCRLHKLVAETFLGPRPEKHDVNHKDGNKLNNRVDNLEYCTRSENVAHAYKNGLNKLTSSVKIVETGETYNSINECARAIDGSSKNIALCLNPKYQRNTHKGYHFEIVEQTELSTAPRLIRVIETGEIYNSVRECAREIGGNHYNILQAIEHDRPYKDLHFEFLDKPKKGEIKRKTDFLYDYQLDAVYRMRTGCILNGGVGSGKSRTSLFYYFKECGGWIDSETGYVRMTNPKDLVIITTAQKRNLKEWEEEFGPFLITTNPEVAYYDHKVIVDSWNNLGKYADIKDAFFIFDEDRVTGKGVWVKHFLKIAKNNDWIILSATPGDSWPEYEAVFVANGFFKTRTEFRNEHLIYTNYAGFPQLKGYRNETRLIRLRDRILVDMDFNRKTNAHHIDIPCKYDTTMYKEAVRTRWDPFKNEPVQQASSMCYVLRRIVNSDESRQAAVLELLENHPKSIIFYNHDHELEILKSIAYPEGTEVAEYNGHIHQPVPDGDKWVYLVNYSAGNAGWNCIKTNCIIFYSQNYSYKIMQQSAGRIDRLNTKFVDLYYYHLKSKSGIDLAISKALKEKKKFNERKFTGWDK